ncbi:MAG: hypothetical protein ACE5JB_03390 [bacterium]
MKSYLKILTFLLFFLITEISFAQQIIIQTVQVNENLEIFFLNDIDILSPSSGPIIFRIILENQYPGTRDVQLLFTIKSENFGILLNGSTNSFPLSPGITELTNRDLFKESGNYSLQSTNISSAAERLKDSILSTGKLPTDTYDFRTEVIDLTSGSNESHSDQFRVRITNPNKLDLIYPGHPADRQIEDCVEIYTNLPQFRWESDMRRFRVIIAEARPREDPESVLNQEPRFERLFAISSDRTLDATSNESELADETIPSTSFQYPSTGEILTLRPGRTYYWRVLGQVETSSGTFEIKSEIYCFRIGKLDQLGVGNEQLEFVLRNLLGSEYDRLFGEGGELEGYHSRRIVLNGKEITLAELLKRLNQLTSKFSGYRVE